MYDNLNRAEFYNCEVWKDKKMISFIKLCIKKYNLRSCIYCPSATGIYFKEFAKLFDKTLFLDIDSKMVEYLNQKIEDTKIKNIVVKVSDIRKIGIYKDLYDCVFFLNQGLQYISLEDFNKLLETKVSKYIVLDLFDFNKKGKLSYFDSEKNKITYLSKSFCFNNKKVNRYNKHSILDNKILYEYNYVIDNNQIKKVNFEMYNYPIELLENIITKSKIYRIEKIYGDYNCSKYNEKQGHYIFVLSRNDVNEF